MAVVELFKSCTSHDPLLMHIRCLAFYSVFYRFQITAENISGILYTAACDFTQYFNLLFHRLILLPYPRQ